MRRKISEVTHVARGTQVSGWTRGSGGVSGVKRDPCVTRDMGVRREPCVQRGVGVRRDEGFMRGK